MLFLLKNRVAIKPLAEPETTASGLLYIPETAKGRSIQGVVTYTGPDCKMVKPGDYVMYPAYNGTISDIDGEGIVIIMNEEDVTAIIEPDTTPSNLYISNDGGKTFINVYAEKAVSAAIACISQNEKFRIRMSKEGWQYKTSYRS